jgi:5-hydroxyisourate hydrolase
MAGLSTHVLDTSNGKPAAGMTIEFSVRDGDKWQILKTLKTNADGRTDEPLLAAAGMNTGEYRLVFHVADYFRTQYAKTGGKLPEPPFLDRVPLHFGIADAGAHYHVPLLCSPWSYSTYRGS